MNPLDILNASVRIATGNPQASGRPGQVKALLELSESLDRRTHFAGMAPTGVGKALLALSAAAHRAINHNERTVISTESLSLQAQYIFKDAPTLVQAVESLGGRTLKVAVLKGVNNYVDPRAVVATACAILGSGKERQLTRLADAVETSTFDGDIDGADPTLLKPLVAWALRVYLDPESIGDRHSYEGQITDREWGLVSASSAEAADEHDTAHYPKAIAAKERVAKSDIIITNHTLLAIQAAKSVPIVIGNSTFGTIHHLIVDEAHALPDEVRARGSNEVSGRVILSITRALEKIVEGSGAARWVTHANTIADTLEQHLASSIGREQSRRIAKDDDPLGNIGVAVIAWAKQGIKLATPESKSDNITTMIRARRAIARLDELVAGVVSISEHHGGEARWIESPPPGDSKFRKWTSAQSSPVDVSGKLRRNLYERPVEDGAEDEVEPLGVGMLSATLPNGFPFQAGLSTQIREFESPFAAAYTNSILFIPQAFDEADIEALSSSMYGKQKFDVKKHAGWAAQHIVALVEANRGSALILAATSENGKLYTEKLRRTHPRMRILSQWDGEAPSRLLAEWREDTSSVLVGVKSLMTGVDAPGETCTLVVLDRIPRSPSNPIDDAIVEDLTDRIGDKWAADRFVYAAKAALFEEQAVGRLIRSVSDSGMAAVLDPRLLTLTGNRRGLFTYPEPTRAIYMKPLYKFPAKTAHIEFATAWLKERRANLP